MGLGSGWSNLEGQSERGGLLTRIEEKEFSIQLESLCTVTLLGIARCSVDPEPVSISFSPHVPSKGAKVEPMWQNCAESSLGQRESVVTAAVLAKPGWEGTTLFWKFSS